MTPLLPILQQRIAASGPISVAEFMVEALLHPDHGYYTTAQPLGTEGDFITSPEISQMFGEMIGLALAQSWLDQGASTPFSLVELGPGRGTLMADILRATRQVPGFAPEVHLVEASPKLRQEQAARVPGATWHDSVDTLPQQPTWAVANEFFDALPIRQFLRDGAGWRERVVGLSDDALTFGLSPVAPVAALAHRLTDTTDGDLVETCPAATAVLEALGSRVALGGAALIIDYGDWRSLGDTLQAVRSHAKTDPLAEPGRQDLTAHVDFEALAMAVPEGTRATRLTPQGVFLERLGITPRAQALAKNLSGAALDQHIAAHRRLTHPEEMGTLFKAIAFCPTDAPAPPGLEL